MQTATSRLHPLLTIAAISVTVLSAVGVASADRHEFRRPKGKKARIATAQGSRSSRSNRRSAIRSPSLRRRRSSLAKPRRSRSSRRHRAFSEAPPVDRCRSSQAAAAAPVSSPSWSRCARSKEPGDAKGVGAVAGGVVGGVLGNKLGKGKGLVTILGAAGGAFAGHQIEKQARAEKRWEIARAPR